jgi:predicted O-methyltransferase YrrM
MVRETLMAAEITQGDAFGQAITAVVRTAGFRSVLEIGSFDGLGSTQVFIAALSDARSPRMVCLETDEARFNALTANVAAVPWVVPVRQPSISLDSFTPAEFAGDVWLSPHNHLRYPCEAVRGWWDSTLAYYHEGREGFLETTSESFDVVLVDGDEFSGYDDYRLAKDRCRCLMLDDVHHAYKCARAHYELKHSPEWRLVWESSLVRNGAAIWVRW